MIAYSKKIVFYKRYIDNIIDDFFKCEAMTPTQFVIKLFEIYYSLELSGGERYPISVVLREYYQLFSNVM